MVETVRIHIAFKLTGKRSESVMKRKLHFIQKTVAGQIRDQKSEAFSHLTDKYKCKSVHVNEYPFTLDIEVPNRNCSKFLKHDCDSRILVKFVEALKVPVSDKWRVEKLTYDDDVLASGSDNLEMTVEAKDSKTTEQKPSVSTKHTKRSALSLTEKVAESSKIELAQTELYSKVVSGVSTTFDFVRSFLQSKKKLLTQLRDGEGYSILYRVVSVAKPQFFTTLVKLGSFMDLLNLGEVHSGITVRELARKKHLGCELELHVRWENSLHALHKVCRSGNVDEARSIIKSKPTITKEVDECGCSVLHWASCTGSIQLLDLLHDQGVTSSALNVKNETALHWAASFGHHNIVKTLIGKFKVDTLQRDYEQKTVVERTAENGDVNFLQELIRCAGRLESTVLPISAQSGRINYFYHVIKKMDIREARDKGGKTALIAAAYGGVDDLVGHILTKYAVDLGDTDYQERNALHWASKNGHFSTVKLLTEGARLVDRLSTIIDVKDRFYEEEFCFSVPFSEGDRSGLHYVMIGKDMYNIFIKQPVSDRMELVKSYGKILITSWDTKARDSLRHNRTRRDLGNHSPVDATALHLALLHRHTDIAKHLIECGADINLPDSFGLTPLHLCCSTGNVDMAVLLDSRGASWNQKTKNGQTPEDLAKINGHVAFMSCVSYAQLAQKFLNGPIAELVDDLAVETLHRKTEEGVDIRRYITDTLRHLVIRTNEALLDLGPGPILEEVGNVHHSCDDIGSLQSCRTVARESQMAVTYP